MEKILLDLKRGPRHWYNELIKAKMSPLEIALGFSVGIFCTMLALPVANLLFALLAIALLRVNKLAVMLGYVVVLWPLSPLVYYLSLKFGFFLFGKKMTISIGQISFSTIKNYIGIFAIGNLLLAALTAVALFIVVYSVAKLVEMVKKKN